MAEDKNLKIISTYEYYMNILEIMLSDMNNITLDDINDVVDELTMELSKIKGANKNEVQTNYIN